MSSPPGGSVVERAELLRGFGIWAALSEPVLQATAAAIQPASFPAGECIIRQGEPGRHLHVLTKGEAEVRVHAGNGAVITVSSMSAGACETLTLDRPAFEALVAQQPQRLREFVRMVSRRLKDSNAAVGAAREKEKGLTRFLQDARAEQYGELVGKLQATRGLPS